MGDLAMDMEVFLKCYTACANQNSQSQEADGTMTLAEFARHVVDAISSVVHQFFPPRKESRADF